MNVPLCRANRCHHRGMEKRKPVKRVEIAPPLKRTHPTIGDVYPTLKDIVGTIGDRVLTVGEIWKRQQGSKKSE